MKKGLIIKLAIVLIVLVLSYCVFWFFKAGQSEKQINKFIADNSGYISAGEISVSGFPVAQKVTISDLKITIPVNLASKRQIIVKQVQATSGIFSNDFSVNITDSVKVQDLDSGEVFDIEFANKPEISLSLLGGTIAKFQYTDSGSKILDAEKNVVNSSASTSILSENSIDETERHTNKINISFKDLEGYTVFDFYKNLLDKKVVEGIKTEEIKVNINPVGDQANIQQFTTPLSQEQAVAPIQPNSPPQQQIVAPNQPTLALSGEDAVKEAMKNVQQADKIEAGNNPQQPNVSPENLANQAPTNQVPTNIEGNNPQQPVQNENVVVDFSKIKSNFTIDLVITLTPSVKQEVVSEAPPSDPTQIQELPVQHVQNIKINNIEMSNSFYKISVTGDAISSSDDNYPSGGITLKIEKLTTLVEHLKNQFKQLSQSKKPTIPANGSDLVNDQSQQNQMQNYDIFLNNVSEKLAPVSSEIASKNAASKDDVAQFDIRREKNLEFLINEVPVREIIGKF